MTWLDSEAVQTVAGPMPSPFDDLAPDPLAIACAKELQRQFATGTLAPGISTETLNRPEGGKMFGVLVVRSAQGRVGYLQAFSGLLGGQWNVDGWSPPLFDLAERTRLEQDSDVLVKGYEARERDLLASEALRDARAALAAFEAATTLARANLKAEHSQRKQARKNARAAAGVPAARALDEERRPDDRALDAPHVQDAALTSKALDDESRRDDRARRTFEATSAQEALAAAAPLRALERRLAALQRLRRLVSQQAMRRIHDCYHLQNAAGRTATLRQLFAPNEPPWGTGDCAGPKLVTEALKANLTPLALAEFWWGPPPPGGGRVEGVFFPACKEKCGPLLPFLLEGFGVAERRTWQPREIAEEEPLELLHEDERIVVLVKPIGMLSVPARDLRITDSVLARLRRRFPHARGPLLPHRLDLDTSGLLVAALDEEAYKDLQAQFLARTIEKRYVALLDGLLEGADEGTICLPLRVDLDQRPRQLVDLEHGKPAVTHWRVLERSGRLTRVELTPHTGRTHQLRVHMAHRQGLGLAILGDRLYGRAESCPRLCLHAQRITFTHPGTGARLSFERLATFSEEDP